jgi:hypothetical protein
MAALYSNNGNKNTMKILPAIVHRLANRFLILKPVKNVFLKKIMQKKRR